MAKLESDGSPKKQLFGGIEVKMVGTLHKGLRTESSPRDQTQKPLRPH